MCIQESRTDPEAVKTLLAAGADWRVRAKEGETVIDMVRLLIRRGAEINAVDSDGQTALGEALLRGQVKCEESVKNKNKKCPDLKRQQQMVDLLKKIGAV